MFKLCHFVSNCFYCCICRILFIKLFYVFYCRICRVIYHILLSCYFCSRIFIFIYSIIFVFLFFVFYLYFYCSLGSGPIPSRSKIWAQNGLRRGPKLEPNDCHTSQTVGKRPAEPNEPLSNLAIRPLAHKKQTMSRLALEAQKHFFLLHIRGLFVCMLVMQCSSLATHVISARIVARHILQQLQKFNGCFPMTIRCMACMQFNSIFSCLQ